MPLFLGRRSRLHRTRRRAPSRRWCAPRRSRTRRPPARTPRRGWPSSGRRPAPRPTGSERPGDRSRSPLASPGRGAGLRPDDGGHPRAESEAVAASTTFLARTIVDVGGGVGVPVQPAAPARAKKLTGHRRRPARGRDRARQHLSSRAWRIAAERRRRSSSGCPPGADAYLLSSCCTTGTTSPVWRSCAPAPPDDRAQPAARGSKRYCPPTTPASRKLLDLVMVALTEGWSGSGGSTRRLAERPACDSSTLIPPGRRSACSRWSSPMTPVRVLAQPPARRRAAGTAPSRRRCPPSRRPPGGVRDVRRVGVAARRGVEFPTSLPPPRQHGTVRIAFDRPEVRNAFRPGTVDELYRALGPRPIAPMWAACCSPQRPGAQDAVGVLLRGCQRSAAAPATSTPEARPPRRWPRRRAAGFTSWIAAADPVHAEGVIAVVTAGRPAAAT